MKTIGLVGGISWVSTMDYYRYINEGVNEALGGREFARCLIYSFNYADVQRSNESGNGDEALQLFADACRKLQSIGAEGILLCANTAHRFAKDLRPLLSIPLIHIGRETAAAIASQGLRKVGLLGTKFTMEMDFIKDELKAKGIAAMVPEAADREYIHHTIHAELGRNIINPATRAKYLQIIEDLLQQGAEGIILGCTEIPLLLGQQDVAAPVFDTTRIHADAAIRFMTGQ